MASESALQTVMEPGNDIKPRVDSNDAVQLLKKLYGLEGGQLQSLLAYDDVNFKYTGATVNSNPYITKLWSHGYVLKIMNSMDSQNLPLTDGQNSIMLFLRKNNVGSPVPVRNVNGHYYSVETIPSGGTEHIVRLLEFQPGTMLSSVPGSRDLYFQVGAFIAQMNNVLRKFSHPAYEKYTSLWHLNSAPKIIAFLSSVKDAGRRSLVEDVIDEFVKKVLSEWKSLEQGMIHGDFNEHNILVDADETGRWRVSSALDFGDSNMSCYLFELAITMCYIMFECRRNNIEPIEGAGHVLAGYKSVRTVTKKEEYLLRVCMCARLCQSLVVGLYTHELQPNNEYVLQSQEHGWPLLVNLWHTPNDSLLSAWDAIFNEYQLSD